MNSTTIPTSPRRRRHLTGLAAGLAAVAMLAACGGDDDAEEPAPAATAAPAATGAPAATEAPAAEPAYGGLYGDDSVTPATAAAGAAAVGTADTDLGTILVDGAGMTLYAFTEDTDGQPSCVDACADAWPPALVDGEPDVGDLDASVFSVVEHPAGGSQLKAGDSPLYTFAGDQAPGDTNGQGSGDVWFVVAADGTLIR